MSALVAIFWSCVALLVYSHFGYPALLWFWRNQANRSRRALREGSDASRITTGDLPHVTVVVAAHNEAERIAARIENLRALDYPVDRFDIAIGSDGSTDATVERARACAQSVPAASSAASVRVFDFPMQRGKPSVLNDLVPGARGELVVLADARQSFEPQALRALVAPFADPQIGAVSGELMLDADASGRGAGAGAGLYWAYEKFLRRNESEIDSTVGATGAIYAIRRSLFEPLPHDTVLDDMLIPCRISRRGLRVIFEPRARAHDRAADPTAEFQRKARTLCGNFQLFSRETWLLNPRQNRLWLQTVSHKILRLACPLLMLGAFLASLALSFGALSSSPWRAIYTTLFACQLAFYAAASAGGALAMAKHRAPILSTAWLFCLLHWATVIGFIRFVRGQATATWKKSVSTRPTNPRNPSKRKSLVLP